MINILDFTNNFNTWIDGLLIRVLINFKNLCIEHPGVFLLFMYGFRVYVDIDIHTKPRALVLSRITYRFLSIIFPCITKVLYNGYYF